MYWLNRSYSSLKGGLIKTVGAYEAKIHLSKLLDRVRKGEQITITKHGVPVAILQPADPARREDPKKIIQEIRMFRENHSLDGLSLRDMINEGRH